MTLDGVVKLIDFGIAHPPGAVFKDRVQGHASYLPPELIEGHPVDQRGDLFSLGLVLWELLTGRRCFRGPDDRATLNLI